MPFGWGKGREDRRRSGRRRKGRGGSRRDPFAHLQEERERAENQPWFQGPDDTPEIDLQAGISSNLTEDDLFHDEDPDEK